MLVIFLACAAFGEGVLRHHHHHHHHHQATVKDEPEKKAPEGEPKKDVASHEKAPKVKGEQAPAKEPASEEEIMKKMKELEKELNTKEEGLKQVIAKGRIDVNGPLPADFKELFSNAVSKATGCKPEDVKVVETIPIGHNASLLQTSGVVQVVFEAPEAVVKEVEKQAADPGSALVTGAMEPFLVAKEEDEAAGEGTPVKDKGIDIDTEMPYGELEPFGREDTAQELTEQSIKESDEMVDQMERAEVAEEKRSVFRALTRLRGAAITSYDGVARAQTGNIDEYNKTHKWRKTHPLHHLAAEESDISKWAFPDNADF